jgi:hypothetical protein
MILIKILLLNFSGLCASRPSRVQPTCTNSSALNANFYEVNKGRMSVSLNLIPERGRKEDRCS